LKQHKPSFDEVCSKLLHQRKHAKLQQLQKSGQTNGDNLNNAGHEISRTFREKIFERKNELEVKVGKNIRELHRSINEIKSYQPRTTLVKDKNSDLHMYLKSPTVF
jgi:hypothetical protein